MRMGRFAYFAKTPCVDSSCHGSAELRRSVVAKTHRRAGRKGGRVRIRTDTHQVFFSGFWYLKQLRINLFYAVMKSVFSWRNKEDSPRTSLRSNLSNAHLVDTVFEFALPLSSSDMYFGPKRETFYTTCFRRCFLSLPVVKAGPRSNRAGWSMENRWRDCQRLSRPEYLLEESLYHYQEVRPDAQVYTDSLEGLSVKGRALFEQYRVGVRNSALVQRREVFGLVVFEP